MEASSLAYIDTEYGIPSMEHYVDSLIEQVRRELSVDEYNTAREALSLGWPSYRLTPCIAPLPTQTTASCTCTTCV